MREAKSKLPVSALWLAAAGPTLYAAGLWAAATADGRSWRLAVCFDAALPEHLAPGRALAAVAMACGAVLLLWITPWLLGILAWQRRASRRAAAPLWSLVTNCAALVAICLVLRHTTGISRESFLAAWLVWSGVLLMMAQAAASDAGAGQNDEPRNSTAGPLLIGMVVVAVLVGLFYREHFLQCFNGDGTEFYELARSLRTHFLPYWEIEPVGQPGTFVANPTVVCSYWTMALHQLLGSGELATRLPFWMWWLGVFVVALRMLPSAPGTSAGAKLVYAAPLAMLLVLATLWYTFYAGYDPYMADVANPGVPDGLFTLLLLLAFDALRRQDAAAWAAAMVLAALLFYAGVVMFVLMASAAVVWQPLPRRQLLRAAAAGGGILLALVAFYVTWGWLDGSLAAWPSCLEMEITNKYFAAEPRLWPGLLFLGYFVLGSGGAPVLGLVEAFYTTRGLSRFSSDENGTVPFARAWRRTVASVALAYLAIVLGCGLKNLHYLGPLMPLGLILWLGGGRRPTFRALVACASLAVCIVLCWPRERPIFTLNRQLGAKTLFRADSYEEACRWARMADELYHADLLGWQISQHTWVGYSRVGREPGPGARRFRPATRVPSPAALCVADVGPPSPEYQLMFASPEGAKLYCRDPQVLAWLATQRPVTGPQRCPWVFQPIAIGRQ